MIDEKRLREAKAILKRHNDNRTGYEVAAEWRDRAEKAEAELAALKQPSGDAAKTCKALSDENISLREVNAGLQRQLTERHAERPLPPARTLSINPGDYSANPADWSPRAFERTPAQKAFMDEVD